MHMPLPKFAFAFAAAAMLAGCGTSTPEPVRSGPRIHAELAGQFADADVPARQLAFSPDGSLLATTSVSGAVTLRAVPSWHTVRRVAHEGGATSVAFSSDGSWFVTGGYDGTAKIWDVAGGRLLRTLSGAAETIWTVAVSPDRRQVATAGEDRIIRLWSVADGKVAKTLRGHEQNIWDVRFSPDGKRLASGSFDASLRLWDVATGAPLRVIREHEQAVVGLDYSRDGRWIATGSDDSTVRLWRGADGALVRTMANGNHAYEVAFSPHGRWIVSAGRARGGIGTLVHSLVGGGGDAAPVRLWRVADGAVVQALPHADDVMAAAFSPDGDWLATAGEDSKVKLWRLTAPAN